MSESRPGSKGLVAKALYSRVRLGGCYARRWYVMVRINDEVIHEPWCSSGLMKGSSFRQFRQSDNQAHSGLSSPAGALDRRGSFFFLTTLGHTWVELTHLIGKSRSTPPSLLAQVASHQGSIYIQYIT